MRRRNLTERVLNDLRKKIEMGLEWILNQNRDPSPAVQFLKQVQNDGESGSWNSSN
jgi:hypothetical protein